jgi:hypothetical protein
MECFHCRGTPEGVVAVIMHYFKTYHTVHKTVRRLQKAHALWLHVQPYQAALGYACYYQRRHGLTLYTQ